VQESSLQFLSNWKLGRLSRH